MRTNQPSFFEAIRNLVVQIDIAYYLAIGMIACIVIIVMRFPIEPFSVTVAGLILLLLIKHAWSIGAFSPFAYRLRRAMLAAKQGNWDEMHHQMKLAKDKSDQSKGQSIRRPIMLCQIAEVYRQQNLYSRAETVNKECLHWLNEQTDENLHISIVANQNLGLCYSDWGRFELAQHFLATAFRMASEVEASNRWIRVLCLCNLARISIEQGHPQEASELLTLARDSITSNRDFFEYQINTIAAQLEIQFGDARTAEQLANIALSKKRVIRKFGKGLTAPALLVLAIVSCQQGQYQQARRLAEDSLQLQTTSAQQQSPEHSHVYFILAQISLAEKNESEAISHLEQGWSLRERVGYPDTPNVSDALKSYADLLRQAGETDKAEQFESRWRRLSESPSSGTSSKVIEMIKAPAEEPSTYIKPNS